MNEWSESRKNFLLHPVFSIHLIAVQVVIVRARFSLIKAKFVQENPNWPVIC